MVTPTLAVVPPRAISPFTGEVVPLADVVELLLDGMPCGLIRLNGAAGTGKTTAVAHLAAVFAAQPNVRFFDETGSAAEVLDTARRKVVVCASVGKWRESFTMPETKWTYDVPLSCWSRDEWADYLLAKHPQACGSVLQRMETAKRGGRLFGAAEISCLVLDTLAQDDSLCSPTDALMSEVFRLAENLACRRRLGRIALSMLVDSIPAKDDWYGQLSEDVQNAPRLRRLLRHPVVQIALAASNICAELEEGIWPTEIQFLLPRELVQAIAQRIINKPRAKDCLKRAIDNEKQSKAHATVASILHVVQLGWRPTGQRLWNLAGGYFPNNHWQAANLRGAILACCDLRQSCFDLASLATAKYGPAIFGRQRPCQLVGADCEGASFRGANLLHCHAVDANFRRADLTDAYAGEADFHGADFSEAILERANFEHANLSSCLLFEASFVGANLQSADLRDARLAGASFRAACLSCAALDRLDLRDVEFDDADLFGARLCQCNLEAIVWPGAQLQSAYLRQANLTGAQMPAAVLKKADLRNSGLADINWEGADLRKADLRGCSFHLGSSRSGLVGSPFASEGSRTGFYTDDYDHQHFKPPEEIRKANLRGADLRGANIEGVDFYLVDLRDAAYDARQEIQFRHCRAILQDCVPPEWT